VGLAAKLDAEPGPEELPAPPPGAAIGRGDAGGPSAQCAQQLLSGKVPAWQLLAVERSSGRLPGRSGLGRQGPGPCALLAALPRTRFLAATPGAHSHSLSAHGSWAQWTRYCSTAFWRPTAAWRWLKSCSWTAGGRSWTPRVSGRQQMEATRAPFPARLVRLGPPALRAPSARRPVSSGTPRPWRPL
jgi:hypothetical protein